MSTSRTIALCVAACGVLALAPAAPAQASSAAAGQHGCLKKAERVKSRPARVRARARCRHTPAKAHPAVQAPSEVPAPSSGGAEPVAPVTAVLNLILAPGPQSALQAGIVDCANSERAKAGLAALAVSPALTRAAQAHAVDMATRRYFDHVTPEGLTPWDRIAAVLQGEPRFSAMGENLAMGFDSTQATCVAWMNSPGHRADIMNPVYTAIGGGWQDGYAVQDFGGRG